MQTTDLASASLPELTQASSEGFEIESPPSDGTFSGDELPTGVVDGADDGADDGLGSPIRQPRARSKSKSKPKKEPKTKAEPKTKSKKSESKAEPKPKPKPKKEPKAESKSKKAKLELVPEEATLSADDNIWEYEDRPFAINCRQSNIQPNVPPSPPRPLPSKTAVKTAAKTRPPSADAAFRGTKRARDLQELGAALSLTGDVAGDFISTAQARAVASGLLLADMVPEEVAKLFEMADVKQPRPVVKAVRPSASAAASASSAQSGRGKPQREVKSSPFPAEDEALKTELAGFYNVPFSVWQQQPAGTHTRYTLPAQHTEPENGVRRSVYAVLGDIIDNGRMCSGYKSDRAGWRRENGPAINYYLRDGSFVPKKAAPAAR
jgi:hypothetical protein